MTDLPPEVSSEKLIAASGYVCSRCGMTVHQWGATRGWKHAAGGPKRGCGATPVVAVTREQFEEDLLAEIDTMHRNGWGIDEARDEIMGLRKSGWMERTDA